VTRRRAHVDLPSVLAGVASGAGDDADREVLDAAESLLRGFGLRRWSVDDVADRAGVGRTSVYRRFGSRDEIVHAVLARELRTTLAAVGAAAAASDGLEDKAVAGVSAALRALDGSVVDSLLRSDPATFLPFLTTEAGPLLDIARVAITGYADALGTSITPELAEAAARFGLSFVLTRHTVLPVGEEAALADAVRGVVRPFVAAAV
jgi:AcrR family transcriptional regulator